MSATIFSNHLIRHRLMWAFIGLAVVPLLLAGTILAWHSRTLFLHNAYSVQQERARRIVAEFSAILHNIEQEMVSVRRYRNFLDLDLAAQKSVVEELLASRDTFEEVSLLDEEGQVTSCLSNTHLECVPDPFKMEEVKKGFQFVKTRTETYLGPVAFEENTGVPVMPLVIPLVDFRSGQVKGALFSRVRLARVGLAVSRISLQDGEDIFIIGTQNRVIAHGNPSTVLRGMMFFPESGQGIQKGLHGETAVVAVETISLGGQEFRIIVEHRVREALQPLYVNILLLVVLLVASLLGSLALASLTDKKIFVPLAELRAITAEFVKGDYSKRLPLPKGRELADLAQTFNQMAENLQQTMYDIALKINERRQVEDALRKSEERFRDLIENTSDWIWEFDENEIFTYASPRVKDLLGYEPEEVVGKSAFFLMADEEARQVSDEFLALKKAGQSFSTLENVNLRKDGTPVMIESSAIPIFDANGDFRGYRGIDRDVSERKKAEDKIQASLAEKEVLLKEIHHRVKNNLQIISSLFFLQIQQTSNVEAISVLIESQNRLRTMALIHERFYQSDDLAEIDFSDYLEMLVLRIYESYASSTLQVQFTVEAEHVLLPVDIAIPCGLVVNELVTNSLKHAFHGMEGKCEVVIRFSCLEDGSCFLTVKDNGIGLADGAITREPPSLGLSLVSKLVGQMNGTHEFQGNNGTECRITFKT